jgi:hypothetical protein
MRTPALVTALAAALLAIVAAVVAPGGAGANATACASGANGSPGYAYAGFQARGVGHGVRATVAPTMEPTIAAGHVAGWIGVGGPQQGPNGETMWLQTGVAAVPGWGMLVYAEITRPGRDPRFVPLVHEVKPQQSFRLAVLEMARRPSFWRVWLNGRPVTKPIHLPGSTERWRPIATAESYDDRTGSCNTFGFRFESVGVAQGRGGAWQTFRPGFTFRDHGYRVRTLKGAPSGQRTLAVDGPQPYAFVAGSA